LSRLHCVLGFDERWPLHCLEAAEKAGLRVDKIISYVPSDEDPCAKPKRDSALAHLRWFLEGKGIELEVLGFKAEPKELLGIIAGMSARIKKGDVLCLGGGMRFLNLALFAAGLARDPEEYDNIYVYLEPEGRPTKGNLLKLSDFGMVILLLHKYHPLRRAVIYALEKLGEAGPSDVLRVIKEDLRDADLDVSKQRVYQVLKDFVEDGIVESRNGKYILKKEVLKRSDPFRELGLDGDV